MANLDHLSILNEGVEFWNSWRATKSDSLEFDLSNADLRRRNLEGIDFSDVNLSKSDLSDSNLESSNLSNAYLPDSYFEGVNLNYCNLSKSKCQGASFKQAKMHGVNLSWANCYGANFFLTNLVLGDLKNTRLIECNFKGATIKYSYFIGCECDRTNMIGVTGNETVFMNCSLEDANFTKADLTEAKFINCNLQLTKFVQAKIEDSIFQDCLIYGLSAWDINGTPKEQNGLSITHFTDSFFYKQKPLITVDDIQVAQFICLLLNNQNLRSVIDTMTSKSVLILGRFTEERKKVLDEISKVLKKYEYLPVIFDFTCPNNRDLTETITILAHLSKFIIADITDAKSIPQELSSIVPFLPSVPVVPIMKNGTTEYSMFEHFKRYPWVLNTCTYDDYGELSDFVLNSILTPLNERLK